MTRSNIAYDLLQATKNSSKSLGNNKVQEVRQIYFLICNSCYWSASYFGVDDLCTLLTHYSPVMYAIHIILELLPISTDESFRIEYSQIRGIAIEFL